MAERMASEGQGETFHDARPGMPLEIGLALQWVNYAQIELAYGEEACRRGMDHAARIVGDLLHKDGRIDVAGIDRIEAVLWDRGLFGAGPLGPACDRFIRSLCMEIAALPFEHDRQRIHLSFAGTWSIGPAVAGKLHSGTETQAGPREHGAFPSDGKAGLRAWALRYREDMGLGGRLFSLMASDRLALLWQRIAHAPDPGEVLYHEALLRRIEDGGVGELPVETLCALERLGLVRALDQFVVTKVIDELDAHPAAVLGVNISAHSAVLDSWWAEAEGRLAGNRLLARRLVIEITETAALPSISQAVSFVDRMHALGCRIALDNFGVGHASIRQLIALKPDIVKVDGLFMRRAAAAERERIVLGQAVALASSVAPIVIVGGVERAADSECAAAVGGAWQQGDFCGRPGVARSRRAIDRQIGDLLMFQNQAGSALTQARAR